MRLRALRSSEVSELDVVLVVVGKIDGIVVVEEVVIVLVLEVLAKVVVLMAVEEAAGILEAPAVGELVVIR